MQNGNQPGERTKSVTVLMIFGTGALAWVAVGGSFYEQSVIDPVWPHHPDLIRPANGGIDRKLFWIAVHSLFELLILTAAWFSWRMVKVRNAILAGLGLHIVQRMWSFSYFIPAAVSFESGQISDPELAHVWVWWSLWRTPISIGTALALNRAQWLAGDAIDLNPPR